MGPLKLNCEPRSRLTFLGSGISKRYANGNGNVNKGPYYGNTVVSFAKFNAKSISKM